MSFFSENLENKKFYFINFIKILSYDGGGGLIVPPIFICKNNRKSNKIMHCVEFFFWVVVVKIGTYYGHFSRIYRSKLSIYLQNYVKNGLIFKTTNQIFFSTQSIILLLFRWFSQIKIKVCKPPIITKVKPRICFLLPGTKMV